MLHWISLRFIQLYQENLSRLILTILGGKLYFNRSHNGVYLKGYYSALFLEKKITEKTLNTLLSFTAELLSTMDSKNLIH